VRAQADQARATYEQTVLLALGEAGNALARALDLAELRYSTGLSNHLEVLDAERSLFDAQLAASHAELGQLTAAVQLYKALVGSGAGALNSFPPRPTAGS
jgi:outer membrane protein TolC